LGGALKSDWANIQTVFAGHRIPTGAPVVEDASKQFIIDPVGLSAEYRAAQSSIPAGEPVLLLAAHAFLWDYQRNPCQIADNAGSASPPPGMPMDNANALAIYLVERGIGYVFVTDVYQSMAGPRDSRDTQPPADRDYITKVLQFQKLVHELAKADAIYEKNGFLVLDLHSADRVGAHSRG
jgi:hypothetical protein